MTDKSLIPGADPRLVIAVAVLFLGGCASYARRNPTPGDCGVFCRTIAACAARANHPKLAPVLCRTARCETGDKCTGEIESRGGRYFGPFQFGEATWAAKCEPLFARRHLDSCARGDAIFDVCCAAYCAAEIVARGGIDNWPVCGKRAIHRRAE